jgi:hypothetical protein
MRALKVLAVMAAIVFAIPALADDDHEGFFIELEGALLTPGNVNTPVVNSVPADSGLSGSSAAFANVLVGTDFDDVATGGLTVGYSWGEQGRLSVSYWSYSDDTNAVGSVGGYGTADNYNWFTIGPAASWFYTFYYDVDFNFTQEIEASTIDIAWGNTLHPNDNVAIDLGVGLRIAEFEDDIAGTYVTSYGGANASTFLAGRNVDSSGFGFTGSLGARRSFNDTVALSSSLRVGFITTDVDSTQFAVDVDGYYSVAGALWTQVVEQEDEVSVQLEFSTDVEFRITDGIDLAVGYHYRNWSDMGQFTGSRATNGTDDQAGAILLGEDRDHLAWSGPRVRIRFRF